MIAVAMQPLIELLTRFTDSAPLQALMVLGASVVLALVVDLLVGSLLPWLARLTHHELDDELARLLRAPTLKTVVLLGLMASASILQLPEQAEVATRRGIATILILVWCLFGARAAKVLLTSASKSTDRFFAVEARTYPLFDNLIKLLVFALCTFLLIDTWNLNAGGWLASAGIIGVAFGFAAQDTLGNLFAGVFIIADAPYKMGDYINLESGERGKVVNIGLRSTRLLTRDDVVVTIPNAVMGKARITNETAGDSPRHRMRVAVSVAYGSDVAEVRRVLREAAVDEELVCEHPEPRVRLRCFADSGLDLELLCWIPEPVLRGQVLDLLNTSIYERFNAAGIEIPYPKRDLYVKEMPAPPAGP
ncbi:MAG: mechanosensitive ion channel protein [Planctomycetes bacterium]|jgi:small-conductance mechanosensitive channel|nr:mechanosensitive ion channel protein [Planctomycetota bacterium]MDP6410066.1 mechanosensitive ion channel family protein [Planctomycetota bacterium]